MLAHRGQFIFWLIWSYSVFVSECVQNQTTTLLVNAVGESVPDCVDAIYRVIETLDSENSSAPDLLFLARKVLYTRRQAFEALPMATQDHLTKDMKFDVKFYSKMPLVDRNIGRPEKISEHVSEILESLLVTASSGNDILAVSFSNRSVPMLTDASKSTIPFMNSMNTQVLLLGKTRRISSVSDWHDLQVLACTTSNTSVIEWLEIVNRTWYEHASRPAYTMLEPRPAMLEATLQLRGKVKVDFFDASQVCAVAWSNGEHHHQEHAHDTETMNDLRFKNDYPRYIHDHHLERFHDTRCSGSTAMFEVFCGSGNKHEDHICAITSDPVSWKSAVGNPVSSMAEKIQLKEELWNSILPDRMRFGSLRYWYAKDPKTPGRFCWDSGDPLIEKNTSSVIYDDFKSIRPFVPKQNPPKKKIVLLTGDFGSWRTIEGTIHASLGKQYYATRHGYTFVFQFSNQLVAYFPHDLFSAVGRSDPYFKGVMSKILMTIDTMHRFPEAEWICFTDSDVWINAEWLNTPLEVFLEDVPSDKLWVQTNYRSMLTGIFFVRNNAAGRKLVRDWLAVGMSGQVSCHGFDQAALMIVFMLRQAEVVSERPFGLSCLSNDQKSSESGLYGTGCSGSDWSCDYKFEYTMNTMGFKTRQNSYFNDSFSTYSRGCANDYVRDFHVTFETAYRPRLQCFHCGKTYEIESCEWDGPMGGGNERVRAGAVNAYFTNHKAEWLFYQQYLEPDSCKKMDFLDECDQELAKSHEKAELSLNNNEREKLYSTVNHGRQLVSLIDDIGVDLDTGIFCKFTPTSIYSKLQREKTFMKDYEKIIAAAKSYNDSYWRYLYRTSGESQSRSLCSKDTPESECPDGMKWSKKDGDWFLAPLDVCSGCAIVTNDKLDPTGKRKAVDCTQKRDTKKRRRR